MENSKETLEQENLKNNKKSLLKSIKHDIKGIARWISKLLVIVSGFGVIYFLINLMANYSFKSECAIFYGVPAKYFSKVIDMDLVFVVIAVALIVASFVPVAIKYRMVKNHEKNCTKTICLLVIGIVLSFLVEFINAGCLPLIFANSSISDVLKNFIAFIFNSLGYFYLFLHITLFIILFIVVSVEMKNRILIIIFTVLILFFSLINMLTTTVGIFAKLTMPIDDKTTYEIVSVQDDSYVVLTEYDNKNLCVKYDVDSDKNFTLYTGEYYFFSKEDAKYSYVTMNTPPEIKNESYVYDLSK